MRTSLRTPRYRGTVHVEFVTTITKPEELKPYVKKSGFPSVDEWWEAAKGSKFLHRVTWVKRPRNGLAPRCQKDQAGNKSQ